MDKPPLILNEELRSQPPMPRLPLYILAGGRSSRFGTDKARAELGGQPLIGRIAEALGAIADPIRVVAGHSEKYADLGLETLGDDRPGLGPLAGLETALFDRLHRHRAGWLILCSCDLLETRPAWIRRLWRYTGEDDGPRAALFADPHPQPLMALYHTDLLPTVRHHLDAGILAVRRFILALGSTAVYVPAPSDWPDPIQANRPEELHAFRRTINSRPSYDSALGAG